MSDGESTEAIARTAQVEAIARKLGCAATPEAIRDALVERLANARAARAANPTDPGLPDIKEKVILKKFDHTPLPGETLDPIETVIIEDGKVTVLPGNGEGVPTP